MQWQPELVLPELALPELVLLPEQPRQHLPHQQPVPT
jgi:hypothetical protein